MIFHSKMPGIPRGGRGRRVCFETQRRWHSPVYSTYLGGEGWRRGECLAVDGAGNAYIGGLTYSDFPTVNAYSSTSEDGDGFVTKFDPTGTGLVYSTYLGGFGWDGS